MNSRHNQGWTFSLLVATTMALSGCAHTSTHEPQDPLEPVNRAIFAFNDTADRYVLRPVAKGYSTVTPAFVQSGVRNFIGNLFYPVTIINQYAQGELLAGTRDVGRFLINSTVGLLGLVDVAKHWGLAENDEDFGQTLGSWGVGEGWYLMLPFLGPSTNRDLVGRLVDIPLAPTYRSREAEVILGITVLDVVQTRADLLSADALLNEQDDRYAFLRSAYLQRRKNAVRNGAPDPEDDFDMDALLDDIDFDELD